MYSRRLNCFVRTIYILFMQISLRDSFHPRGCVYTVALYNVTFRVSFFILFPQVEIARNRAQKNDTYNSDAIKETSLFGFLEGERI